VLPLSSGELARAFPDLWRTKKAARRDRAHGWGGGDRRLAERAFWAATAHPVATTVTYRAPGQVRGSPHRALVAGELSCPEAVRLALAPLLGAVTEVAVVATLRRPPDRPSRLADAGVGGALDRDEAGPAVAPACSLTADPLLEAGLPPLSPDDLPEPDAGRLFVPPIVDRPVVQSTCAVAVGRAALDTPAPATGGTAGPRPVPPTSIDANAPLP
jgi:hypothetical protein